MSRGCSHLAYRQYAYSPILRCAAVMLLVLAAVAFSSRASCDDIHAAAKRGDLAKVTALLKANPGVALGKDVESNTPLQAAEGAGFKDMAALLLANGAKVDAEGKPQEPSP